MRTRLTLWRTWLALRAPRLTRWGLVSAVLLLAAGLGAATPYLSKRLDPWWIVPLAALPVGLLAFIQLLRHWEWMPALVLLLAAFVPIDVPTGTGSRLTDGFLLTLLFCLLWGLRMMVERRRRWERTWLNLPLVIFFIINYWSVGWSLAFRDVLVYAPPTFFVVQLASATVNVMLPGAFLLAANFLRTWRQLQWFTGIMLAAGAVGLVQRYDLLNLPVNVGGLFNLWVVALAAGLALFWTGLTRGRRLILGALAGAYLIWGVFLHISWLAGWLPAVVAIGVLLFMRSKRLWLLVVLAIVVAAAFNLDYVDNTFNSENSESGGTRLAAWETNWEVTGQHLLFGTGPAGYAAYYMSYFPERGMATHNNYIDIIAQYGLFGTAAYLVFFGGLVVLGYRLCARLRGRQDFAEALANAVFAGLIACVVAMGFGDWLLPFAYTQTIGSFDYEVYSWLFLGTLLVIDRLTRPDPALAAHA